MDPLDHLLHDESKPPQLFKLLHYCRTCLVHWGSLRLQWRAFTTRWSYGGMDKQSIKNSRKKQPSQTTHTHTHTSHTNIHPLSDFTAFFVYCEGGASDAEKAQTTCVLILDIYLCLFLLSSELHGSNFCCDESENKVSVDFITGRKPVPIPTTRQPRGI